MLWQKRHVSQDPTKKSKETQILLYFAFFLAGIAGLSYELIWVRYIGRIVGGATQAISATIAIFFLGLALGSWIGSIIFAKMKRPLRGYALLEIAIGAYALIIPPLIVQLERITSTLESLSLLLFLTSLIILPATILLGATFPAMAATLEKYQNPTDGTAHFYGINTLGAVFGCLLSSLVLLPKFGYFSTNLIMVSVDGIAAVIIFFAHRSAPHITAIDVDTHSTSSAITFNRAALLAAISGFIAIGVEVLWTRALALAFPATIYIFAIVLSAYLFGIGLGSLLLTRIRRFYNDSAILFVLYVLCAFFIITSIWLFPWSSDLFYEGISSGFIKTWSAWISGIGLSSMLAMLPATLMMGASLPLLIGLATNNNDKSSKIAGRLYMLNVVGGVLGSLITTFAFMPRFGLTTMILVYAGGYIALAFIFRPNDIRSRFGAVFVVSFLCLFLFHSVFSAHGFRIDSGRYNSNEQLIFAKDSASGTIEIFEEKIRQTPPIRSLKVNNFYGLNKTAPSIVALQYRLGVLPLYLHSNPKRALLIGFATGNTLAAMANHGRVSKLDCVELHHELFELSTFFRRVNLDVVKNRKVNLIKGDGRRYMLRHSPTYDVIVGDLYLPRNPGVGNLYSLEYFRSIKNRLNPKGIFVAWLPMWQLSPWEIGVIIKTLRQEFPNAEGVIGNPNQSRPILGLIAEKGDKKKERSIRFNQMTEEINDLLYKVYQQKIETSHHSQFLSNNLLREWEKSKPINNLDNAVIEFSAPKALTRYQLKGISPAQDNLNFIKSFNKKSFTNTL